MPSSKIKIALVHDYLREYGGAERVLEALHELFPTAPVFVAFTDPQAMGKQWQRFADWKIHQSWLTKIPFYKKLFSPLRVFSPQYFSAFDLRGYDVIISSTNAYFSKAITVPKTATHICYCHTPARSLYGYSTMTDWKKNPFFKLFGTLINHYLRVIDVKIARDNVDVFVANSHETARRIKTFYKLDATVVFPPVNVPEKLIRETKPAYYLYVNRLALAKHPELAVQAANQLKLPLKVVGTGAMLEELKKKAGPTVEFYGSVSDQELDELYAGAQALLYPVEDEDFGIVPIEAMGHGVPVIAHRSGGPQETIIEEKTGMFFDELSLAGLVEAILLAQRYTWDAKVIHKHAQKFAKVEFQRKIKALVAKASQ